MRGILCFEASSRSIVIFWYLPIDLKKNRLGSKVAREGEVSDPLSKWITQRRRMHELEVHEHGLRFAICDARIHSLFEQVFLCTRAKKFQGQNFRNQFSIQFTSMIIIRWWWRGFEQKRCGETLQLTLILFFKVSSGLLRSTIRALSANCHENEIHTP